VSADLLSSVVADVEDARPVAEPREIPRNLPSDVSLAPSREAHHHALSKMPNTASLLSGGLVSCSILHKPQKNNAESHKQNVIPYLNLC
jgi:hypothetical protein